MTSTEGTVQKQLSLRAASRRTAEPAPPAFPASILFAANFSSNIGYAWDNIERFFAAVADRLHEKGLRTFVAYPRMDAPPRVLDGSRAVPIELDVSLRSSASVRATAAFARRENVRLLYLTDRRARSLAYPLLRLAGVRQVIVHDRVSGRGTPPRGLKRVLKTAVNCMPWLLADHIVCVSRFVADRQREVGLVPPERVVTIRNGVAVGSTEKGRTRATHDVFQLQPDRPLIACAGRASPEKGIHHLLKAFDRLLLSGAWPGGRPALLYCGDGPQLEALRRLRHSLPSREDIILAGYRSDARDLLHAVDICVVPSLWQDAFPSAVLEAMARGKPVIASAVGGIPEMIDHGVSGLLVPAGDEAALADAMRCLITNPAEGKRLGRNARERVVRMFTPERQVEEVTALISGAL
jgi:glycosyltransferase involved in cell wall biosynthesis